MATPNTRRSKKARADDLYTTPPGATEALLARETFTGSIWEPACGKLDISRVLESHGYDVFSSDLYARGQELPEIDFLKTNRRACNVITNPPFTLGREFLEKALEISSGKVAFFVRVTFLETQDRMHLFQQGMGLKRIYFFVNRVDCPKGGISKRRRNGKKMGGSAVFYCWVVYEKGWQGTATPYWISDKVD